MEAHWISVFCISFTILITPFFWFLFLPKTKALKMGLITAILASITLTINLFDLTNRSFGSLLIVIFWIVPTLIVWKYKNWFRGIDQKPLVGLQVFRFIGAFFLLEMIRLKIPKSFALPAGIGDIIVGFFALVSFLSYKKFPKKILITLIIIGMLDFVSAFFFGFTSFESPFQLFAKGFENKTNLFPTGMIPLFLVPYAIIYHVLSIINLKE